ncbi:MAG: VOC family protein [Novipirellula sp. JB048]
MRELLAISYEKQTFPKCRENDLKMKILSVVETSIYVDDLDATEDFYLRILGLKVIARESDRHVFFQVGESNVLLAFNPQTTCTDDKMPHHGATGPGHLALGIELLSLDDWRRHLEANDVSIETEVQWPAGGKSIYFRDPAGNSVELITPGVWQLPSGW